MSKEKQIEEMAITACHSINLIKRTLNRKCEDCGLDDGCNTQKVCKVLYNAGYRKIPTTDWLTKGISKEELEREKEEALKEFFERNCEKYGYRKQIEGEWIWTESGQEDYEQYWVCSCCHEKDYFEDKFCPNCGAKMKGGAE